MRLHKKLASIGLGIMFATNCMADSSQQIHLDNIPMISPGNSGIISLSQLSGNKLYTIEAVLQKTKGQEGDYRFTSIGTTNDSNKVTANGVSLKNEDGQGYKGHFNSNDKSLKITFYNVKPNDGLALNNQIKLENISSPSGGAGIELKDIVATEQPQTDSRQGDDISSIMPLTTGNDGL